jgi:hypothetical protein
MVLYRDVESPDDAVLRIDQLPGKQRFVPEAESAGSERGVKAWHSFKHMPSERHIRTNHSSGAISINSLGSRKPRAQ